MTQSTITTQGQAQSEQETYEIGKDAYIYAHPLVLQDVTIRHREYKRHAAAFPPTDFKAVV